MITKKSGVTKNGKYNGRLLIFINFNDLCDS